MHGFDLIMFDFVVLDSRGYDEIRFGAVGFVMYVGSLLFRTNGGTLSTSTSTSTMPFCDWGR